MIIKYALLALVVITFLDLAVGMVKKKGKYTLKRDINNLRFIATLVVAMFLVVGIVELSVPIAEWAREGVVEYGPNTDTAFVLSLAPFVWIGAGIWAVWRLIGSSFKPIWKYSDEEMGWNREDSNKNIRRLKKLLPFLPIKEMKDV